MSESSILKQLKEMAQITIVTGRISTVQEKNLKTYPRIFLEGFLSGEVEYDLSPIKAGENGVDLTAKETAFVTYKIKTDGREITDIERRGKAIRDAVHVLFWSGIIVTVYIDGKLEYRSVSDGNL